MADDSSRRAAAAAVFRRMDEVAAQCGGRFPLFRVPEMEEWTLSRRGSWMGGFWAGLWWLRAAAGGRAEDRERARRWSRSLAPALDEPSVNRSFVFWYGATLGWLLLADDEAAALSRQAAAALAADFDAGAGLWPLGAGMGAGPAGRGRLNVDALAPTLALMQIHGELAGQALGRSHLAACLARLAREDGAWCADVPLEGGEEPAAGQWQRGQAWAILGLARAVQAEPLAHAAAALRACVYWNDHWGAARWPADADDPCARAIAAVGMYRLGRSLPEAGWLHDGAAAELDRVLSDEVIRSGRFPGHRYRIAADEVRLVESPCATFFLLEALLMWDGVGV